MGSLQHLHRDESWHAELRLLQYIEWMSKTSVGTTHSAVLVMLVTVL
jgi:membrane protein required for beta-lactamase induction